MTVATTTHPFPGFRIPKRTTAMAAAVLGLAIAATAVLSSTGTNDPATSAPDAVVATDVTHHVAVDQSGAADHAAATGLRGLSPASAAPATHHVGVDQSGAAAHAAATGLRGLSPASAAPVEQATGTGYPDGFAESIWAQLAGAPATVDGVLPRASFASDADWIQANGWGQTSDGVDRTGVPASYVAAAEAAATGGVTDNEADGAVSRSGFASDMDWIEANGWGPR